jgi:hypothetical protein
VTSLVVLVVGILFAVLVRELVVLGLTALSFLKVLGVAIWHELTPPVVLMRKLA